MCWTASRRRTRGVLRGLSEGEGEQERRGGYNSDSIEGASRWLCWGTAWFSMEVYVKQA